MSLRGLVGLGGLGGLGGLVRLIHNYKTLNNKHPNNKQQTTNNKPQTF
jgi:hypothetical protein